MVPQHPLPRGGARSIAYARRFAPNRTLKDAEIADARDPAVADTVRGFAAVHLVGGSDGPTTQPEGSKARLRA